MNYYRLLFIFIASFISCNSFAQTDSIFVYVKIQEVILPIARGEKYEDPLDAALQQEKLGSVSGAGTSLAENGSIEWVGLDVELNDFIRGIPFLKAKLIELGVPKGSTIEYTFFGNKVITPIE